MSTMVSRWLARRLDKALVRGIAQRRPPDFIIGDDKSDPYMRRWWVIPRNRIFNVYLHEFLKDDDDRALHDHPWWSVSLTLNGDLREIYKGHHRAKDLRRWYEDRLRLQSTGHHVSLGLNESWRVVRTGDIIIRSGRFAHRMIVPRPSWTLFITGPVYREWGFLCPKGWRPWREFVSAGDKGGVGKGCE